MPYRRADSSSRAGRCSERKPRRHVGLWHETYTVPEGAYESVYTDMPAFGLAAAAGALPLEERGRSAKERFTHRRGESA